MASTKDLFCYHCRVYHPASEVKKIVTKTGTRYRCYRSIEAAKVGRATRDAFGRQMTEINRAEAQSKARVTGFIRSGAH